MVKKKRARKKAKSRSKIISEVIILCVILLFIFFVTKFSEDPSEYDTWNHESVIADEVSESDE